MTDFLVMSAAQAAALTGLYASGKAIQPRPMADGRYALPTRLLDEPDCMAIFPALSGLSTEALNDSDFASEE